LILTVLQYVLRRVRVKKDVRHAKTSVLVAGERKKVAEILVPVDGPKGSGKALKQAVHARAVKTGAIGSAVEASDCWVLRRFLCVERCTEPSF
jgi:hypothetical protein